MTRDLDQGFAGCLGDLCHEASSDIFVTQRLRLTPGASDNRNWWNGESEGNWRAGFIQLAYLSGNEKAMREADAYVRHILSSQSENGYLGVFDAETRFTHQGELWTQACLLRGLLDYAELTGNAEVMKAVQRAADLDISMYGSGKTAVPWQEGHDLMISDVMERLFDLTGDPKYRDFTVWLYQSWGENVGSGDVVAGDVETTLPYLLNRNIGYTGHGANIYESIRVPLWLWTATGREDFGRASRNALDKLGRYTETSGSAVSDEDVDGKKPDPTFTEYEYCATKEIQFSLESALQKTGMAFLGDSIERIWFNAAQGARFANGKAITYLSNDNRERCDGMTADGARPENRNKFSPTHTDVAVCCNPNASNIASIYVRGMWMRHPGSGGLAAVLYGPCGVSTKVGGVPVILKEKTNYPFENAVEIEVRTDRPVRFPILLRDPSWSRGTTVACEGAEISRVGSYWTVTKRWRPGDRITIKFAPVVQEVAAVNGEVALQYGALLFAQPIDAQKAVIKKYPVQGFEDAYFEPVAGKYEELALPADLRWQGFGFRPVSSIKGANFRRPFDQPVIALQGRMIQARDGSTKPVMLVPLGNASVLRRLTFPISSKT